MYLFRRLILPPLFAATLLIGAVALIASGMGRGAQAADSANPPRTIVVSGDGEVSAKPDQARLSAGVATQGQSAAAAMAANTTAMNRVFASLRAAGIPDNKIQTSNFSVQPQYSSIVSGPNNPDPQRITGYQVSNQVTVMVDDLAKLGPTLDALVKSGANQLGGIGFSIANPKPFVDRARSAAVADGAAKARNLAMAAGVNLGPLLSIQESGGVRPGPIFAARAVQIGPPIAEGEQTVTANVTMTYAIQ